MTAPGPVGSVRGSSQPRRELTLESRKRSKLWPLVALAAGAALYRTRRKKPVPYSWAKAGPAADLRRYDGGSALLEKPAPHGEDISSSGASDVFVETLTDLSVHDGNTSGSAHADGWIQVAEGESCPIGYPIKGNATSRIYHLPGQAAYEKTIPEICFATEEAAALLGYRPRKR